MEQIGRLWSRFLYLGKCAYAQSPDYNFAVEGGENKQEFFSCSSFLKKKACNVINMGFGE